MSAAPDDLVGLATSVCDGSMNWGQLYSSGLSQIDPALLRELQVIEKIAEVHRNAAREPDSAPAGGDSRWSRFVLRQPLGEGSFGRVYRANDPRLQRDVALKIYKGATAASSELEALFAEGRLLARVKHPNIVVVHDVEAHGDEVGLSLELVDGRTLAEEVRTNGPLGFREAALTAIDVGRALAALHGAGLIHRDVKPQNVMRERGGRIVLMDFGLGRDARKSPASGADRVGTPLYMAPEVLAGKPATVASDIYSLGVLLFFLVTGEHPVSARTRTELEEAVRANRRVLLRDLRPDLPDAFVDVVDRAMAADPSARYATAGAMQGALSAVLGLASEPAGPARRAARSVPIWLVSAAIAVLAVGAALWNRPWRTAGENPQTVTAPVAVPSPTPAPAAGDQYDIQATLQRATSAGSTPLAPGARVTPGDHLYLEVKATVPVHVYVVNHDERGESYLLFPLPGQRVQNPLAAGVLHRLPGAVDWEVTSAGGREHFLIVASPKPLGPLEAVFATLPKPKAGRPVIQPAPVSNSVIGQLRGIGGLAKPSDPPTPGSDLFKSALSLTGASESVSGPWIRQLTLENPGR